MWNQPGFDTLFYDSGNSSYNSQADGLQSAEISLSSAPVEVKNGLSNYIPGDELEGRLTRGETPLTPSYKDTKSM